MASAPLNHLAQLKCLSTARPAEYCMPSAHIMPMTARKEEQVLDIEKGRVSAC